ncbi:MAG: hypothetical protein AB8Y25_00055 [Coxiella endosymbiont of Haemaphysalis qinghaiensis]
MSESTVVKTPIKQMTVRSGFGEIRSSISIGISELQGYIKAM